MGYLAQKKKHERQSLFLKTALIIFSLLAVGLPLASDFFWLKPWLFQIYVLNLVVLIYAFSCRYFLYAAGFALCLVVNYFQMAAFGPLFFSEHAPVRHTLNLTYAPESPNLTNDSVQILRNGYLVFEEDIVVPFAAVVKDNQVFNLIRLNLEDVPAATRKKVLKQLQHFVTAEDDAVVIYGHFGMPAWTREMKRFLQNTGLEVRNRLIFTHKGSRYSYLQPPTFYVLSFRNIGVEDIKILPPEKNKYPEINLRLGLY